MHRCVIMERWRYKLWESTWLFLYKWNESMNPSADQKREIEETAMGPIERDVLASPGRHKEANGAQGTAPEAPEPWGLTAAPTEPTGEPPVAQGGWGRGAGRVCDQRHGAGGRPLRRRLGGAARTEDFGFAVVGEGNFWVRDSLPVWDSNPRIGLVFAFPPLETVSTRHVRVMQCNH